MIMQSDSHNQCHFFNKKLLFCRPEVSRNGIGCSLYLILPVGRNDKILLNLMTLFE